MEPTVAQWSRLRYMVYADRHQRQLIAAFTLEGDARQFLHVHCPCSGMLIERTVEASTATSTQES